MGKNIILTKQNLKVFSREEETSAILDFDHCSMHYFM